MSSILLLLYRMGISTFGYNTLQGQYNILVFQDTENVLFPPGPLPVVTTGPFLRVALPFIPHPLFGEYV